MPDAPVQIAATPGQVVLTVGAGQEYSSIAAAIAAAPAGALIEVQAGTYVNDFADITRPVTIVGVGGMVNMVATEDIPNEKGFFIVDNSCQIDNFTFQGAHIDDSLGGNAAGIRYQGGNLVLNNDAFVGNQDGLLATGVDGLAQNTITVTNSTFDNNGNSTGPNAGYTHNLYVSGGVTALNITHSVLEEANVGHELKSRAETNVISNNIFYDGPTGTASYSIDLPDGGADTVSGNLIEKGPMAENDAIIHFGGEGLPYAGSGLLVTGNHFINDLGANALGVLNQTTLNVNITGNEFDNFVATNIASGPYTLQANYDQNGAAIANDSSSVFAPGTDIDDFSGDSLSHSVTLTTPTGVLGGGGLLNVVADAGHVTVIGGSGGLNYQEGPGYGGSEIITAAGASDTIAAAGQDLVQAAGNDQVIAGAGNLSLQVTGNATVAAGSGADAFTINGNASITGGNGTDAIQVGATANASLTGTFGFLQSTLQGGVFSLNISQGGSIDQATITGGSVAMQAYGGNMVFTTSGGTAGADIAFGLGTVSTLVSNGADTIMAGSGPATIIAAGAAQIHDGTGSLSVFGHGASGATIFGGAGAVTLGGDTGDITYLGGAAANAITDSLCNTTLIGGSGLMSVTGGSVQKIQGGSGGLVFSTATGADNITTAAGAHDTVSFAQACTLVSAGTDHISAGDGNATITALGNATINGSSGAAFYTLNGADSLSAYGYSRATVGSAAHDTITAYGSLTDIAIAGGTLSFHDAANADKAAATVCGTNASLQFAATGTSTQITLGGQGDHASLGAGHIQVAVSAAATHVTTGAGTDTISVYNGGGTITAGAGALTVNMDDWTDQKLVTIQGGSGTVTQGTGYGNLVFVGGTGSAKLGGLSGSETVTAGAGNISLTGGATGTVFTAGSGNATVNLTNAGGVVTFGSGATSITEAGYGQSVIFDFASGHGGGNDTITGFRAGTDHLDLQGVTMSAETITGGSALVTLSDGTHLTLAGLTVMPPLG